MVHALVKQDIEAAFEESVGTLGASRERFSYYVDKLVPAIPRILSKPQREAAPVFALPAKKDDLAEIEEIASHIANHFSALVVAGMGGSSLSGEALLALRKPNGLKIQFIDNIDPHTLDVLTQSLEWKKTAFLFISKSGNTIETLSQLAVLLRVAKDQLEEVSKHFFVITIPDGNALHTIAQANGMRVLPHDRDLGGRFSILSSVGMIPAAAAGLDIRALRKGAMDVLTQYQSSDLKNTPAVQSAALHLALSEKKVRVNVLMHYGDRFSGLANWYRQCWGESLGKCDGATTPVPSRGTTDQHSQLQLYLDGPKDKLFTLMMLESQGQGARIDFDGVADPRFDYLKNRTLGDLMVAEQRATQTTLINRGCPVRSLTLKTFNEETMGALLMHFTLEVVFAAELLGVNAFDQPAVEDSKVIALKYLAEIKS